MENKVIVFWIVYFFSDDDSGIMKVFIDIDDEFLFLFFKVSIFLCYICILVFILIFIVSRM